MATIAATGTDRSQIFEYASQSACASASYFREVDLLSKRLGYDYGEACRVIGEATKEEQIRSFLLRLSAALSSGEREDEFLSREAQFQAEVYSSRYQRELERLSGWTLAWVGLIVSTTLIVIISLVSSMIFPSGADVTIFVTVMMGLMALISLGGVWFIYHTAPRERRFYSLPQKSPRQRLPGIGLKVLLPVFIALAAAMAVLGVDTWIILLAGSVMVFPIGVAGLRIDRRVDGKDGEIGTLFRSLGGITAAIGMTIKEGLDRLDMRSIPALLPDIERLRNRLGLGLEPALCWQRFSAETGSETARRSSEMFYKAAELGGDSDKIGGQTSSFATTLALLRERRKLISLTFRWICLGAHAVSVALLMFIVEMVAYFATVVERLEEEMEMEASQEYLAGVTGDIFMFNFSVAESFPKLIIPVVLVLSVVNALAAQATEGGHWHKFFFYLGITLAVSAVLVWVTPPLVEWLFAKVE